MSAVPATNDTTSDEATVRELKRVAKSEEQFLAGNLPRLLVVEHGRQRWSVASRTTGGEVWVVTLVNRGVEGGLTYACTCPGKACWHRVHVRRARAAEIPHFTSGGEWSWSAPVLLPLDAAPRDACPRCGALDSRRYDNGFCSECRPVASADLMGGPR